MQGVTLAVDRADIIERLRAALAASIYSDTTLELMPDKGLAHHHVRLRGRGIVARIPKQSQMNLDARENLSYQAACFQRASAGGHAPHLIEVLKSSAVLPRGALLVEEVVGVPAFLPQDLPAIAQALASIHALPLPAPSARVPLLDPEQPLAAMAAEIRQQAEYLNQAGLPSESRSQIVDELQGWYALLANTPEPPKALIAFDAHPGNFLVRDDGRAVLVDLEKARYSCPAFDLAHATLYTSTTWDIESAVELGLPDVLRFILAWRERLGGQADRWDPWLIIARGGMWLWSVTWCAKWKALSQAKSDQSQQGEDWSTDNSAAELVHHVRDRVECYLSPAVLHKVHQELQELHTALRAHGI